jgi:hypothetical protein
MAAQEIVVPFPNTQATKSAPGSFERLWGKALTKYGYAAIPSIMVRAQHRLGVTPTQFCILVQLIEHWRSPDRPPFPSKQQLADRLGVRKATIKHNMAQLEKAGLIQRKQYKTASGDWGANTYFLDGLVARLRALEPDFAEERQKREAARRRVETPKGRRGD